MRALCLWYFFFFFNDTAPTEISSLPLHASLPICTAPAGRRTRSTRPAPLRGPCAALRPRASASRRSEEHTSELQSQSNLVCRLLLEKKTNVVLTRQRLSQASQQR